MHKLMVIEFSTFRFEKGLGSNTVNVYGKGLNDEYAELDCFTNYEINDNWTEYEKSCERYAESFIGQDNQQ